MLLYTNYLYPDAQHVNKLAFNFGFNIRLPIKRKDKLENLEIYKDTGNPYDRQGMKTCRTMFRPTGDLKEIYFNFYFQ